MPFDKMAKQRQMSDQFNAIIARVDNTEDEARHDVVDTPDKPPWKRKVCLFSLEKNTPILRYIIYY
jgi:hypothetical protein